MDETLHWTLPPVAAAQICIQACTTLHTMERPHRFSLVPVVVVVAAAAAVYTRIASRSDLVLTGVCS